MSKIPDNYVVVEITRRISRSGDKYKGFFSLRRSDGPTHVVNIPPETAEMLFRDPPATHTITWTEKKDRETKVWTLTYVEEAKAEAE